MSILAWSSRLGMITRPRIQIVAIGAPGSIDSDELTALFAGCVLETAVTV